ncbi:MAG: non-heme iron oxygenase ferredoxin subunit [Nocardioidaceae bacterium]
MGEMVRACSLSELTEGSALAVEVGGTPLALVRCEDEVFAIHDECSHAAIPLSEGDVEGCEIECWLHGSRFDLRTGKVINLPATEPVPVYACTVNGDDVLVDVTTALPDHS